MNIKSKTYGVVIREPDYPVSQFWYKVDESGDCVCHRGEDLPASINDNGYQAWYLNDRCLYHTNDEFVIIYW